MSSRRRDWQKPDDEAAAGDQTEREGRADLITAGSVSRRMRAWEADIQVAAWLWTAVCTVE